MAAAAPLRMKVYKVVEKFTSCYIPLTHFKLDIKSHGT